MFDLAGLLDLKLLAYNRSILILASICMRPIKYSSFHEYRVTHAPRLLILPVRPDR